MLDPWFKRKYPLKHLKKWLYWPWAEYQVLRDAAAVLFTCEEERLLARQSFWLYRAHEAVASYGTDAPPEGSERHKAAFLLKFPECRDQRLILHLGRIQEKKGCDVLIEAFARIASRRLGVGDRITWTGMLSGSLKWGALRACEVLGLPSHQENFGVVVVEALACGKPVLISNKVNIWREIEADGAGIVAEDDVEGTVRNLEAWLALDTTEYATMSQRAEACFHQRFHIQTAARQLLNIVTEYVR
jgi:glycosyltransferase involved in cell wall biosynthesis